MGAYPDVSRIVGCQHRPKCPDGVTRWACGKRTEIEAAVAHDVITRAEGASLLVKMGVTMTPPSRVYQGAAVKQTRLL